MNHPPQFLTTQQVMVIHARVIEEFGGDPLLRDAGLLDSAVMLPAAQYAGEFLHANFPAMAGAYLFHICRNHAFLDGNKRTALAAAEVFLLLNNYKLKAANQELERLTRGVAEGRITKAAVIAFFQEHTAESEV